MMRGFDSIESMNSEELLVRRKKGNKRYLVFGTVCGVFFVIGVLIGYFSHPSTPSTNGGNKPDSRGPVPSGDDSFNSTQFILANVDKDKIRNNLREYSKEPRLAGTKQDADLAKKIQSDWIANGLDEVHMATYDVLLSFPNTTTPNLIQIKNVTSGQIISETKPYEVALTPAENNSNVVPPFNAFSPAGDVTGDLVYVNYGTVEDFMYVTTNLSFNLTGTIVIARYGKIFRGDKVENAQHFNAAGVILYSDPRDFSTHNVKPYPNSWWLPGTGIQRGTVYGDGDIQTPLYPSTYYANRIPVEKVALQKIPCQPIGYEDAYQLLGHLVGPEAPATWQGGLNFTYRIGPGYGNTSDLKVRLIVNNYIKVKPVYNVIGYIKGREEPDRYVLIGNHHDAWVFGAVDPLSGTASVTEITRVFGQMLKKGHRPRRTLVFCSWDAEEPGLIGSIEWVEDHLKVLLQRGVAYLNMDSSATSNFTLAIGTSPLLQDAIYEAAKHVPSQDPSFATMYDMWLHRPRSNKSNLQEPQLTYSLGSGSDMAAFYQRAGISSIDMVMTYDEANIPISTYPLYHSSYETFYAFDAFIDPGFTATAAITKLMAILAINLADSELLPMKVERYSRAIYDAYATLATHYRDLWQSKGVDIESLDSAVHNFSLAAKAFQEQLDNISKSLSGSPLLQRMINDKLMQLERAFLDPEGLPGRPDQKHMMFAPSQFDSYIDNSFPGIVDTMFQIEHGSDKWDQLKQQVYIATYTIQSAVFTLQGLGL
ncbi:glutamate carboxypeptidase 2-like isoform X2 [Pomacea canaliculata]|uniref:glutamate carboxypeptidase 2-like isoform X2 n=1 Tax=Pomacea canaliculata TaxID=400727 RepID=UPI000D734FA6|nr:glutamate carboxypeptidase 2-like isoform X2 [Pomacea canaliculata]XP_025076799.1 glutamate carboxypeptidase 2-like isoform X2 [Pomacea canaliculata]XP_025076800.1 glutamate carboxypeptidase 2-like isoform X2 [Pomacea canaliculata]